MQNQQNQLTRRVLFRFIQEAGLTSCHRCGLALTQSDFSLDHILPWRNSENAEELFWDIDNIAFSHRGCNSAESRTAVSRRKQTHCKRGHPFDVQNTKLVSGGRNCKTCLIMYQTDEWKNRNATQQV